MQNRDFENLVSLHVTSLKTGFLLTYLTEGSVMTKIHSPAGLVFLFPVKIGAPPSEKVSWNLWYFKNSNAHAQPFRGARDFDFDYRCIFASC